jgi:hypothetical protein
MGKRERIAGWLTLGAISLYSGYGISKLVGPSSDSSAVAADLGRYLFESTENVTLTGLPNFLQVRDPVFLRNDDGTIVQAGYVLRVDPAAEPSRLVVRWHDPKVSPQDCEMVAQQNEGRLDDLLEMMFPPPKRERIEVLITAAIRDHGQQLSQRLIPIFERSMRDSLPAIEAGFRASVQGHRRELDRIAIRWNDEIVDQRLLPLAKKEIVPIVRRNAEPLAQVIGRELWDRASVWSFTWRAIYDKTPLPRKDLMKQEWDRFVEQEAMPVFEAHAAELAVAVQDTMLEVSQNKNVRAELAAAAEMIARDPEASELVQVLLRESIMENIGLRKIWADAWTSAEAKAAIAEAGRALEPTIRQIGDEVMGTREKGIDPGFAKLLRNQVLQKDQRWIMATPMSANR